MDITKLCVSVPNMGTINAETVYCLILALFKTAMTAGCGLHLYLPSWGMLDNVRRDSVKEALDIGASHLLFVDGDMTFPDDGILTLASRDKPIIGAKYNKRRLPLESTVMVSNREGRLIPITDSRTPKMPFRCGAIGTGFLLIQTEVFKQLPKPWFKLDYNISDEGTTGEDIYFCRVAQENGVEVWCDPTIRVKHIGYYLY